MIGRLGITFCLLLDNLGKKGRGELFWALAPTAVQGADWINLGARASSRREASFFSLFEQVPVISIVMGAGGYAAAASIDA